MTKHLMTIIYFGLTLSGCGTSYFIEPKSNPVIEDKIGGLIGTLATTAERRIVLVPYDGENKGKFCAEPSPDTAEALASTFSAALDASASVQGKGQASLKAELAKSLLTSVAALTKRSQGLQFFRDGMFALCQSRMNNFIDNKGYLEQLILLRTVSQTMIMKELEHPNWNSLPPIKIEAPNVAD